MTEDNNTAGIKKPHGLVLFTDDVKMDKKEEESYAFENVDQENAIKLLSESAPFASHYRYSILLANESSAPITEVKTKIKYPSFLKLIRISPPNIDIKQDTKMTDKKIAQVALEFFNLPEKSKKQINLFFSPTTVKGDGELTTFITFVNAKDYVRVLNSDSIDVVIKPISLEPKIVPSNYIQPFFEKDGIKKAIKSIGLATQDELNFELIYNHIVQVLKLNNFQVIAEDKNKKIAWTFGTELESNQDILMIGQIVSNKIEFLGASMNHGVLIPILTGLVTDLIKRFESLTIISREEQVYELDCQYCGTILPQFPAEGQSVICRNCKKENFLW